jgi:hypothetical protein
MTKVYILFLGTQQFFFANFIEARVTALRIRQDFEKNPDKYPSGLLDFGIREQPVHHRSMHAQDFEVEDQQPQTARSPVSPDPAHLLALAQAQATALAEAHPTR